MPTGRSLIACAVAVATGACVPAEMPAAPSGAAAPPTAAAPAASPTPAPPVSPATAAVVAGGELTGKAKLPVGLVAGSRGLLEETPAGVIANHGGNLISANGSALAPRFALLAAGQRPLIGFKLRLVDAAGQPVLDAAGKPYETVSDLNGDFKFAHAPAGRNLVVELVLPGSLGRLVGLLPSTATGPRRELEIEGVGTHVFGYVLARAVKGDQARLERLAPEAEAGARAEAEAALAAVAKGVISADSLATEKLIATVGVWRELSKPFDAKIAEIEARLK